MKVIRLAAGIITAERSCYEKEKSDYLIIHPDGRPLYDILYPWNTFHLCLCRDYRD